MSAEGKDIEVKIGERYIVHIERGGVFVADVARFERDGNVAVLMPTRSSVRDVFPAGYEIGRAHWASMLERAE